MNKQTTQPNQAFFFLSLAVLCAALSRLIPHPFNFTPIGAMALFAGAGFQRRWLAFAMPLSAMLLSDVILQLSRGTGFHSTMWAVYGSFALIVCIGFLVRKRFSLSSIICGSLASSLTFFLVTNFAVWLGAAEYGHNFAGLLSCYAAGIPFYNHDLFGSALMNTVMGDLFFTAILFGAYKLASLKFPELAR
ncbi:MAG TPA: DUF6580 family putative transport protein, partial [Bacteroidia bacterium]|nr:DUF6580 family putative transport protein [Bacteroidia bacterium]